MDRNASIRILDFCSVAVLFNSGEGVHPIGKTIGLGRRDSFTFKGLCPERNPYDRTHNNRTL